MLRRLLSLLSLICDEHKIYYSKLKILKSFWEDAGLDYKKQLMFKKETFNDWRDKK